MSYRLGLTSEENLVGVDGGIVSCARRSITTTLQDFGVFEGLRNLARQLVLFKRGASRTMDSRHLPDKNGIGHALDLVPYIDGRLQWQTPLCLIVAQAMHAASLELKIPLVWGGVWDRALSALDPDDLDGEVDAYVVRYQKTHPPVMVNGKLKKRYPLIDPPHFQDVRP